MIAYLKTHDATPYHDLILYACLHNTTYDTQVEGYKTDYILEIINLTDEPDYYQSQILDATKQIDDETDERDTQHLIALTAEFAKLGDTEAKRIIYHHVDKTMKDDGSIGVTEIVEIDGIDGFVYVIEKFVAILQRHDDPYWDDYLVDVLKETIGDDSANKQLDSIRQTNATVNLFLEKVEERLAKREDLKANHPIVEKYESYADIKSKIDKYPIAWHRWGQQAKNEDLELAAQDLISLDEPFLITRYLMIFKHVPFPLDPTLLFRFVDMDDTPQPVFSIPIMALSALDKIQHPSVRDFAFSLLKQNKYPEHAIGLLALNYKLEDWRLIEEMIEKIDIDDFDYRYHRLGFSVEAIFKQHPDSKAKQTLLNMYEYNPCMNCRETMLEMLQTIDAIPDDIRDECRYDASEYIRRLAKNNFVSLVN